MIPCSVSVTMKSMFAFMCAGEQRNDQSPGQLRNTVTERVEQPVTSAAGEARDRTQSGPPHGEQTQDLPGAHSHQRTRQNKL